MGIEEIKEFVFKITVLGNSAVGKTSLINQYIEQSFKEDYKPTLGANIIRKDVFIDEINAKCRLILWDLAGQEKYNVIRSMYFQGCVGALLVYDVTRHNTFSDIQDRWLKDFKKYVKKEGTYVLIGNKADLEDHRAVSKEEGEQLANSIEASDFIETSAKLNQNVDLAFKKLVHQILRNHGEEI
ncbi:MAG: GTP-binding protein [Candidatus Lokiarchaeota archaeon]|nr:GTP-binding protein [Candidatus Lokiarchaeota archaeon]